MNIAMLGVGGIGGYYAARLIEAGHDLTLVARGKHLAAMQADGLRVNHTDWAFHKPVTACTFEEFRQTRKPADIDLICLAIKAQDTDQIARELRDWYGKSAQRPAVISLQNGVDNEILLARQLGENTIVGALCVGIGAHITEPGVIESTGPARIVMGIWPNQELAADGPAMSMINELFDAFSQAGVPTEISDDIRRELWRKLIINNGVNPLSALTGLDTRTLSKDGDFSRIVLGLMLETVTAAKADGVELGEQAAHTMLAFMQDFDAIKTSMLVDKEKGRPLELDAISGAVLERSERLGRDAPYTRLVHALLKYQQG
ncbi:MAG: 2-dehydropantoate 2-reductase [Gammaproteobacteria bacterium]|nr:2-dehydropantoate 2-reductase [Gammaproteobacteria bacterium]